MNIEYTTDKKFTKEDIQELFLSVGWVSGQYPNRLYKALMGSSTVLTAWNGEHLAGLVRVIDDSELVAFMHYVLVNPKYKGQLCCPFIICKYILLLFRSSFCCFSSGFYCVIVSVIFKCNNIKHINVTIAIKISIFKRNIT